MNKRKNNKKENFDVIQMTPLGMKTGRILSLASACYDAERLARIYCGETDVPLFFESDDRTRSTYFNLIEDILNNPGFTMEEIYTHAQERAVQAGWKYAEVEDREKKESPMIVSWKDIDEHRRILLELVMLVSRVERGSYMSGVSEKQMKEIQDACIPVNE